MQAPGSQGDSPPPFGLSQRARRSRKQPISYLMAQAVTNPALISLAAGLVDYDMLPGEDTAAVAAEIFGEPRRARTALQYGTTLGLGPLRERLLAHVEQLDGLPPGGFDAAAEQVVISTGSQQMLFLLTDALIDPGDIVITGWPSYFVYTGTLESAGAEVRCVDVDEDGMVPEQLERMLERIEAAGDLSRVKIVYVVSYHQNPTGLTVSQPRRPRLLEIVRRFSKEHRILLLEDAAYRELTYEGDAPPSIKSHDDGNRTVALVQTFSKPFSPGLKTGYSLLPADLIEPIMIQKGNHDFGSANLLQEILLAAMDEGVYARHLERLRAGYRRKRDAVLAALSERFAGWDEVSWTRPRGGLYVWLTVGQCVDTCMEGELCRRAIEEGVLYVPGEFCYPPDPTRDRPGNTIRLSFGVADVDAIGEGIARLARAYAASRDDPSNAI